VNGEDILFAMTSLGFENYAEALKIYLSRYREVSCQIFHLPLSSLPLPHLPIYPSTPFLSPFSFLSLLLLHQILVEVKPILNYWY